MLAQMYFRQLESAVGAVTPSTFPCLSCLLVLAQNCNSEELRFDWKLSSGLSAPLFLLLLCCVHPGLFSVAVSLGSAWAMFAQDTSPSLSFEWSPEGGSSEGPSQHESCVLRAL